MRHTLVLSFGNTLFKKTSFHAEELDYRRLVANLILKTYKDIGYDAINVGEYDLTMGIGFLKSWRKRLSLPFISANLKGKEGKGVFDPFRIVTLGKYKIGILGVMKEGVHLSRVPDGALYHVTDPVESVKEQVKTLKKRGVNFIVLLTDMTSMECKKITHLKLPINVIIGSSRKNRLSLPRVSYQRLILHLDRYGKHIGKLSLYCLKKGGKHNPLESRIFGDITFRNAFIALKKEMPRDVKIAARMDGYLERIRILKNQLAMSHGESLREGENAGATARRHKRFVGVEVCRKCHEREYNQWKKTPHSRAYLSLVKKGSQYDVDCIGCHSIGFRQKGGFKNVSKNMMPYVNVQCEACHGPGGKHVKNGGGMGGINKLVSREICLRCHTEEHSPDFIYRVFSRRLACGKKGPVKAEANK